MKKLISALLAVLLLSSVFSGVVFADGDTQEPAVFTVSTLTVRPGQPVEVTVSAESALRFSGLTMQITYDGDLTPVLVENDMGEMVLDYTPGAVLTGSTTVFQESPTLENTLSLGILFPSSYPVCNGDIISFSFTLPESAQSGDEFPITITVEEFYYAPIGQDKVDLPNETVDGAIIIAYPVTVTFMDGAVELSSVELWPGDVVERPDDPVKEGYTFDCWLLNGSPYNFEDPVETDLIIMASWIGNVTVTFMDGETVLDVIELVPGSTVDPLDAPINDGYDFAGWLYNGSLFDFDTPVNFDIILRASWITAGSVMYLDYNSYCERFEVASVESYDTFADYYNEELVLEEGWYVVSGLVEVEAPIIIEGDVRIILTDGCELYAYDGIVVNSGNFLTIYAQSFDENAGKLTSDSSIGSDEDDCGCIVINGGIIEATGSANKAAIGAPSGYNYGSITINGGDVTATGARYAAAIGGGNGSAEGVIIINGGNITANAGNRNSCGIGSPSVGSIEIYLGWNSYSDSIFATSYKGVVTFNKLFKYEDSDALVNYEEIDDRTIVPLITPSVSGVQVVVRDRSEEDNKANLRFVYRVDFNESMTVYCGNEIGPRPEGYNIIAISVDLYVEGSTNVHTVDVANIWDVQLNDVHPYFLFTVVVTGIPENKSDKVICTVPTIEFVCGEYSGSVTLAEPFCGSVNSASN